MNHPASSPSPAKKVDAVRAKRAKVAKYTLLANRVGYLFFALAIATFIIGFAVSFNGAVSAIVIGSVIAGSVLLAPAIVLGYAVKAAERHDRERGL
jgi:ABC-type multidrug transport system permease subunit